MFDFLSSKQKRSRRAANREENAPNSQKQEALQGFALEPILTPSGGVDGEELDPAILQGDSPSDDAQVPELPDEEDTASSEGEDPIPEEDLEEIEFVSDEEASDETVSDGESNTTTSSESDSSAENTETASSSDSETSSNSESDSQETTKTSSETDSEDSESEIAADSEKSSPSSEENSDTTSSESTDDSSSTDSSDASETSESETTAKTSEESAEDSESQLADSSDASETSESETTAKTSEESAEDSETTTVESSDSEKAEETETTAEESSSEDSDTTTEESSDSEKVEETETTAEESSSEDSDTTTEETDETTEASNSEDSESDTAESETSPVEYTTGKFTVDESGQIGVDYLFDGGGYEGEVAIFSLEGMEEIQPGSREFIQEAANRAASDSESGHIVISDQDEGAKFEGRLGEENQNAGSYQSVKTFQMKPGDEFGVMLVPNGRVSDVVDNPDVGGDEKPLFSLKTANPNDGLHFGQIVDVTGEGNTFAMEDWRVDENSDRDYNDVIFQVRGASGEAPSMDEMVTSGKDWRGKDLGKALIEYTKPYITPEMPDAGGEADSGDTSAGSSDSSESTPSDSETTEDSQQTVVEDNPSSSDSDSEADSSQETTEDSEAAVKEDSQTSQQTTPADESTEDSSATSQPETEESSQEPSQQTEETAVSEKSSETSTSDESGKEPSSEASAETEETVVSEKSSDNSAEKSPETSTSEESSQDSPAASQPETEEIATSEDSQQQTQTSPEKVVSEKSSETSQQQPSSESEKTVASQTQNSSKDSEATQVSQGSTDKSADTSADTSSDSKPTETSSKSVDRSEETSQETEESSQSSQPETVASEETTSESDSSGSESGDSQETTAGDSSDDGFDPETVTYEDMPADVGDGSSETTVAESGDTEQLDNANDGDAAADSSSSPNQQSETETTSPAETKRSIEEKLATTPASQFESPKADQPLVGVIDTGFAGNNPDINYDNVTLGQDRVDGDDNPLLEKGEGNQHGTHTLGLISAQQNNGEGIDGINDEAPVWLGRGVGGNNWEESLNEFVDQVQESGRENAVVNLSMDLTQTDEDGNVTTRYELTPEERKALEYARQNNVAVVVAAGNDGGVMSALGQASQEFDNLITVGAAEETDASVSDARGHERADYSSYGRTLDIVAEGGTEDDGVFSTVGDGVGTMKGSSVATAKVTGAVSQVWAANPDLSYRQVLDLLKDTATDLDNPNWDEQTGAGLLNIAAAVNLARVTTPQEYDPEPLFAPDSWSGEGEVTAGERAVDFNYDITHESFDGTVAPIGHPWYGVAYRRSPEVDDKWGSGMAAVSDKYLEFDAWTYGEAVNDFWTGKADELWYRIAGTDYWVPSAYIYGYPNSGPSIQAPEESTSPDPGSSGSLPNPILSQKGAAYFENRPQYYTYGNIFAQSMYGSSLVDNTGNTEGNCTWYAHGRVLELGGNKAALQSMTGNANEWHHQSSNGTQIVSNPQPGDIAQWTSNGANHVAVVERVNSDGTIVISESHWKTNWDGGGEGTLHNVRTISANDPDRFLRVPGVQVDNDSNQPPAENIGPKPGYVNDNVGSVSLNFRSGPSVNDSIIGKLPKGSELTILEEVSGGEYPGDRTKWYKVEAKDKTGYVAAYYVTEGSDEEVPPQPGHGGVPHDAGNHIETQESSNGVVTHYYENGHLVLQPNGQKSWYEKGDGGDSSDSTSPNRSKIIKEPLEDQPNFEEANKKLADKGTSEKKALPWNKLHLPYLKNRLRDEIADSFEVVLGWKNAARHLRHYLNNTGSPIEDLNVDSMIQDLPDFKEVIEEDIKDLANRARRKIKSLGVHNNLEFSVSMPWDLDTKFYAQKHKSKDWFYALGGFYYRITGVINSVPSGSGSSDVTANFKVHVFDRYNWDEKKKTNIMGIEITDKFMGEFHKYGLANEYNITGSSTSLQYHWNFPNDTIFSNGKKIHLKNSRTNRRN
ncbi:S8 family serine peptidase [Geitlerinema sp. PCC 9228]|uniref:S8 family serine peptidase n=1 Tax=Geitlerinema sp. PCC 9228 TaxID=111611 RepID=UPI0008F998C1|nr:S8 family serine peptidase [Geitlerinema sp. PCC 9228]